MYKTGEIPKGNTTIERMPEPPLGRFGPDETPHFIQLDGALWPVAAAADA
jgi:hypothetical protein